MDVLGIILCSFRRNCAWYFARCNRWQIIWIFVCVLLGTKLRTSQGICNEIIYDLSLSSYVGKIIVCVYDT